MLQGLTITHISLPVRIFEPYSTLQRIINLFSFMPKYLPQAAAQTDPLERMKLVIASAISGSYLCSGQLKPFNPILGETLQCHFPDGTQILCEHTSHHPPISNFSLEPPDNSYQFYGYYEFTAKMGANNMRAGQRGPNVVRFNDGQEIRYNLPDYKLGGTVMGNRTLWAVGTMVFEDEKNRLKAVINFDTFKKSGWISTTVEGSHDEFSGVIYKTTNQITKANSYVLNHKSQADLDLDALPDKGSALGEIFGSWLGSLSINGKEYWNIDKDLPLRYIPNLNPLPSDWRFREDLIWLRRKHLQFAEKWKLRMEVQQRHDRKNRNEAKKKKK